MVSPGSGSAVLTEAAATQFTLISTLMALCREMVEAPFFLFFFQILFLFVFRERGGEKERQRNINVWLPLSRPLLGTWPTTQGCALTGNQTSDPLVHRMALNPLSHTSSVSYTHLTLPTTGSLCRSRWSPYH